MIQIGYSVPTNEQETIINFGRSEQGCVIWTSDTTMMTKLDKMVNKSAHYSLIKEGKVDGDVVNKEYKIDNKNLISFRSQPVSRTYTDEQRAEIADRFTKIKHGRFS